MVRKCVMTWPLLMSLGRRMDPGALPDPLVMGSARFAANGYRRGCSAGTRDNVKHTLGYYQPRQAAKHLSCGCVSHRNAFFVC
uniref:Uncharacterized protein n=1 Tax=Hyaloperonospora arabidopsidis (strain Emoy2) TaxID=559515 RepID=M4B6G5_HYAAE